MTIISKDITKAIQILENDEVLAIPTETVYGLAGNIYSPQAIKKIFEIKQRPLFNPLIVHLFGLEQLNDIVQFVPDNAIILAEKFWPGPLTLVLKKSSLVPDLVTAGKDTVAVRIPNHPITLELLRGLSFPIAAPSANPFNRISPTCPEHVQNYFEDILPMILDGGTCHRGLESTILGFEDANPVLYRHGAIAVEDIEKEIGKISIKAKSDNAPLAPGMLKKHYSPKTKTILTDDLKSVLKQQNGRVGVLSFKDHYFGEHIIKNEILSPSGDLSQAASRLYSVLHILDELNLDVIIAEKMPDLGLGQSINDRLARAAE